MFMGNTAWKYWCIRQWWPWFSSLVETTNTYNDNTYHLLVATYDWTTLSFSIDNWVETINTSSAFNWYLATNNSIWFYDLFNTYFFSGGMKKNRIYNRVLNAGEIAALYAEG